MVARSKVKRHYNYISCLLLYVLLPLICNNTNAHLIISYVYFYLIYIGFQLQKVLSKVDYTLLMIQ